MKRNCAFAALLSLLALSGAQAKPLSQFVYEDLRGGACTPASSSEIDSLKKDLCLAPPLETRGSSGQDFDQVSEWMAFESMATHETGALQCLADENYKIAQQPELLKKATDSTCSKLPLLADAISNEEFLAKWIKTYTTVNDRSVAPVPEDVFQRNKQILSVLKAKLVLYRQIEEDTAASDTLLSSPLIYSKVKKQIQGGFFSSAKSSDEICSGLKTGVRDDLLADYQAQKSSAAMIQAKLKDPAWITDKDFKRSLWNSGSRETVLSSFKDDRALLQNSLVCRLNARYGEGLEITEHLELIGSLAVGPGISSLPRLAALWFADEGVGLIVARAATSVSIATGAAISVNRVRSSCAEKPSELSDANSCKSLSNSQFKSLFYRSVGGGECAFAAASTIVSGGLATLGFSPTLQKFLKESFLKDFIARSQVTSGIAEATIPLAEEQAAPEFVSNLVGKTQPFSSSISGATATLKITEGRLLRTSQLTAEDLPYANEIRPVEAMAAQHSSLPVIQKGLEPTDILLASDTHSGSAGYVRLASLEGRPVAIKSYITRRADLAYENESILEEAKNAKLLSDIGVGPKVHGVYLDKSGHQNLVMDIVAGDFSGTRVTQRSFDELRLIEKRMADAKITRFGDLQIFRTRDGHLQVIDANFNTSTDLPPTLARDFDHEYANILREADVNLARSELAKIHAESPERFHNIQRYFANYLKNTGSLPDYLKPYLPKDAP